MFSIGRSSRRNKIGQRGHDEFQEREDPNSVGLGQRETLERRWPIRLSGDRVDESGNHGADRGNQKEEVRKEKKPGCRRARLEGAREKRRRSIGTMERDRVEERAKERNVRR